MHHSPDKRFSLHGGGDGWHEIEGGECLSELREGEGIFILFKPWNQYGEKPPSRIEEGHEPHADCSWWDHNNITDLRPQQAIHCTIS